MIHIAISLVSFPCMIVGMYVLFRTFILAPAWQPLVPWIVRFPAAALPLFLGQSRGPWGGILQRLLVLSISLWMIVVALRARAITTKAEEHRLAMEFTCRRRHHMKKALPGVPGNAFPLIFDKVGLALATPSSLRGTGAQRRR
jgi:hypothetical protein